MSDLVKRPDVMTVTLEHSGPVELEQLSDSLRALAGQHARFAERAGATFNGERVRLYVRQINSGSIIVELVELAAQGIMLAGGLNTVVSFAKNLAGIVAYGRGMLATPPEGTTKRDVEDFNAFLQPVATDARGLLTITTGDRSEVNVVQHVVINSEAANATQSRTRNWASLLEQPVTDRHAGVLFYWDQARKTGSSGVGDRGVIEALSPRAVRTSFANDQVKQAMLRDALFQMAYVVDVQVQTINGRLQLYRIIEVQASFPREDDATP